MISENCEIDKQIQTSEKRMSTTDKEVNDGKSTKIEFEEKLEESNIPDGGWGWFVLIAALVIRIAMGGLLVTFGLFLNPLVVEYKTSQSTMSWMASLMSAMNLASAPIAGFLSTKFSNRVVVIIGSILAGLSFAAPYFYSPLWFLFLSSILTGTGMGIAMMYTTVVLTTYFDKRLSMVLGIFTSGTGIASFIITPLFEKLIHLLGWRFSMLIYGFLFFGCAVCALIFKQVSNNEDKKLDNKDNLDQIQNDKKTSLKDVEKNDVPVSRSRLNVFVSTVNFASQQGHNDDDDENIHKSVQFINQSERNQNQLDGHLYLSNLSVSTLAGMSIKDKLENHYEVDKVVQNDTDNKENGVVVEDSQKTSGYLLFLKNPTLLIFLIGNLLTNLGHDTTFIFAKVRAMNSGIEESKAGFLLVAIGIGNTLGRLVFGYLGSKKSIKTYPLYCTSLILCGGFLLFSSVAFTYPLMLVYTIGFGLFIGSYTTLTTVVLLNILGLKYLSHGLVLTSCVQAIGLLICSPLSGLIFDVTKTFNWSFITSAFLILGGGLIMLSAYLFKKFRESQNKH